MLKRVTALTAAILVLSVSLATADEIKLGGGGAAVPLAGLFLFTDRR